MNAPARIDIPRFATIEKAIGALKPVEPIYCLHPQKFKIAAQRFLEGFPGDPMYAVKANPVPQVLDLVYAAGIRHFDTASLSEVALVRSRFDDVHCHFMAPVRLPGHAKNAFEKYGVTDYVVDCDFELDKLIAETKQPQKLRVFVRLATQLGGALLELSSKFGTTPQEGARLLKRVAELGAQPCITFHVGSQCLSPFSYAQAIEITRRTVALAGIDIAALDIGGGFPGPYANNDVPPYHWYFDTIREALATLERPGLPILCEPGRALIAEGMSLITQVVLRKGDRLFLNDGTYGSFDELTLPGWNADYPNRVFTVDAKGRALPLPGDIKPFRVYGPTCDTLDVLPRPQMLPDGIGPGDFIVFDMIGAYSAAVRTGFNGFYPDSWVQIGN
ncbi:MAG: type III PLP-dependent enzyme [Alphaproteobacteria bacterium]|nr:type III PLP-dependent enzyme [Alphaproteobacteria bacterium]